MWDAEIIIKDLERDTIYTCDTINSFNWQKSVIKYTPDSVVKAFEVQVNLLQNNDQFFPIKDTVIYVNNTSDSVIIRKIEEQKYEYKLKVLTNIIQDEYSLSDVPVKNATIMMGREVSYTDADGVCNLKLKKEIQPKDTILIFREGYLSECRQWGAPKEINIIYIQMNEDVLSTAWQERQNRMMLMDTLAQNDNLNYTQTLSLKRNEKADDIIFLRAFEDKKQDISGGQGKKYLKIIKGCYYYQSECPQVKKAWEDVPLNNIYLLDGYVDESQKDNPNCVYFFEGTDMANNKEQFFGVLNGNSPWKNGQYIIPGKNGLSGTYQHINVK